MLALVLFWHTASGILKLGGGRVKVPQHSWNYVIIDVDGMETAFVGNSVGEVRSPGQWDDRLTERDAQEILLQ